MMRKLITVLAIATACILALTSCGTTPNADSVNQSIIKSTGEKVKEKKEETKSEESDKAKDLTSGEKKEAKSEESDKAKDLTSGEKKEAKSEESDMTKDATSEEKNEELTADEEIQAQNYEWNGEVLTAFGGVADGPSGRETYYNLPMGGVVQNMRNLGFDEENYPYWVRDDGCKMLGDYIIVAADFDIRPEGTVVPTSLGMGIVCDTGTFAEYDPTQLDVAVSW